MYAKYFGLKDAPFSIAPNPRFLYMSPKHREALGHLLYGVGINGGFVLLTGEVGTGKTTICRCLLEQLPDNTDIAFVLNPLQEAREMLENVCDELGVALRADEKNLRGLSKALYKFLLTNHAKGRNTVLLIDEAQNLDVKVLELIRLLTNLETNTKKLLQIIFIGQPELNELLAKPELRQLAQRITARFHIDPLSLEETGAYISHRLQVAGLPANQQLFSPALIKSIHQKAGGIPRLINVLCDRMLLGAYTENKTQVDANTLSRASREIMGATPTRRANPLYWQVATGLLSLTLLASGLAWLWPEPDTAAEPVVTVLPVEAAPAATAAEPPPAAQSEPAALLGFASEAQALSALFDALSLPQLMGPAPCEDTAGTGISCTRATVKNWKGFLTYNRPAVLALSADPGPHFVAVLAVDGSQALVLMPDGRRWLSLMELGNQWTGELVFTWAGPAPFEKAIGQGDRGPMVRWLAQQFANLDQQQAPLADEQFTAALAERVKIFQRDQGLEADGLVGLQTLLKLNEALGLDRTLSDSEIH